MIVLILLFIIICILISIQKKMEKYEGFGEYSGNIMGYEEGLPDEYRNIDYPKFKSTMRNMHEYKANNWHLRFPYMINPRYSYDDKPNKCKTTPTIYNYAHLKELPLNLKDYFTIDKSKKSCRPQNVYPLLIDNKYNIIPNQNNIYGFDYNNMNDSTINAGDGTPDEYYDIDRLNNRIY